ncbi:collagen alpha-6(VI) chain-like [Thunnus thynnus]|uniref:collagen alpha-6(VI) chain-like n=1 Tax=Thunnus thynnus TaxID=8237 RepID=UPI0035287349
MDHLLMLLLLLWSSGLQAEDKHQSTGSQCESTAKADIVLLVDGSGSIGSEDYENIKSFLNQTVSNFNIGPDKVQIGLVQYDSTPRTEWHLNTHQTKQSLLEAMAKLRQPGGGTNTGEALKHILHNNFKPNVGMRADSHKIAILITDGQSSDDVSLASQHLKDAGIDVYAIGVGNANEAQLRVIASDPIKNHMYMLSDFSSLLNIINNLTINLCNSTNSGLGLQAEDKHQSTGSQCESTAKADIVLLVDGSGSIGSEDYENIKSFLNQTVSNFNIGPDKVQIGLVQYDSTPRTEWHLNTHQTKQSLLEAMAKLRQPGGGTNTGEALKHILHNNFKPNVGMRADSHKIAILITDGQSSDDVSLASQHLKDAGIDVYAIGVGNANQAQLRVIASDPIKNHMYMLSDFSSLLNIINNLTINLCNSTNSGLGLQAEDKHQSTGSQCESTAKADIVLLVDGSGSIGSEDYENIKSFLNQTVSNFNIGPDKVQIGLVQYDSTPRTEWHLNTHQTKQSLLEAMAKLRQPGGGTNTGKALNYILDNNFKPNVGMHADSHKIAILITDGESSDDVSLASQHLKDAGIDVYAIGVGNANEAQLRVIASYPVKNHVYTLSDFSSLLNIVNNLTINLCNSTNSSLGRRKNSLAGSVWRIRSDCVQSGSTLRECASSSSSSSIVELICSDLLVQPIISVSSTMDGVSEAQQQGFQVRRGSKFTISCSVQPQYPGGSFHLTFTSSYTTYNYTLPAVHHSADFLFPAADPVHQGSYSCVYEVIVFSHNFSSESRLLSLTVTDPTVFIITLVVLLVTLLLFIIAIYFIRKASRGQKSGPQENTELDSYNLGVSKAEGESAEEERSQRAE